MNPRVSFSRTLAFVLTPHQPLTPQPLTTTLVLRSPPSLAQEITIGNHPHNLSDIEVIAMNYRYSVRCDPWDRANSVRVPIWKEKIDSTPSPPSLSHSPPATTYFDYTCFAFTDLFVTSSIAPP